MSSLRAFVAIQLPEELAAGYMGLQRGLGALGRIKWVEPRNLHLTLKFLGRVEHADIPRICAPLARAATGAPPATLHALRVTAFPNERGARVLVVELTDAEGTAPRLQEEIERELALVGIPAEDRAFRLHLTLGRVWERKADARTLLARASVPATAWPVNAFQLIESKLGPSGPTYTVLESFRMSRRVPDRVDLGAMPAG